MNRILIGSLVIVTIVAPLSVATHTPIGRCDSAGTPAAGIVGVGAPAAGVPFVAYVDDRNLALGNGLWVYLETNGQTADDAAHSLQRGGQSIVLPDDPEICRDYATGTPDALIV